MILSTVLAIEVNSEVVNTVYQRLSVAWKEKYVGTGVLDYLLKSLDGYVEGWKKDSAYAAPWTCIIQSSGWGKCRSVCELSTKGVYVVYISFSDRAIPHGTPGAKTYFTGVQNNMRKIGAAFVECLYHHLASEMEKGQSPEQLIEKQTSQGENLWNAHHWGRGESEVSRLPTRNKCIDVTLDEWKDEDLKHSHRGPGDVAQKAGTERRYARRRISGTGTRSIQGTRTGTRPGRASPVGDVSGRVRATGRFFFFFKK